MSSIFISYRRKGALIHARALFERLHREFGANEVFIDVEGVDYGLDFIEILNEKLNGCQVMLAVIDPQWATATDKQGRRRIDREHDYVRTEIVTALSRGIRTVPVLIDGAEMPEPNDLPEPLRPLTRRNALMLDFNRFDAEISRLISVIRKILAPAGAEARAPTEADRVNPQEAIRLRGEAERQEKQRTSRMHQQAEKRAHETEAVLQEGSMIRLAGIGTLRVSGDLEDALALAQNQSRRDGKTVTSTRYVFAAIRRLNPEMLTGMLELLSEENALRALPPGERLPRKVKLDSSGGFSQCVTESLTQLKSSSKNVAPISVADLFVDVAKFGKGASVAHLRDHGFDARRIDGVVRELKVPVRIRRDMAHTSLT